MAIGMLLNIKPQINKVDINILLRGILIIKKIE